MSAAPMESLLSYRELSSLTGLSRATIWRRVADSTLPKPLRLSPNRVAWRATDIQSWVDSLPNADTDST